ncbi:MAG: hypothetical protein AB1439_04405 [candidate division FCPU426 bacterium]
MKKGLILLVMVFLLGGASAARADVFGTAGILRPGGFALGIEPSLTFNPSDFTLYLHGGVGLTRGIDLDLKLGLGSEIYFGGDVEFSLIPDTSRTPGLSFTAGAHGANNFGLDAILLLSNRFSTFSLYGALDADIEFVDNGTGGSEVLLPLYFDLGVAIPVSRAFEVLLEGNIAITNVAASGLSGGVMFYF